MNILSKNIHWFLRVHLFIAFIYHGYPKLGESVANLGYIGYLVGPFEFIGALFIMIGPFIVFQNSLITRLGGLMLAIIMIGAIYLHVFQWGDSLGDVEWQMLLLSVSLMFVFKGDEI